MLSLARQRFDRLHAHRCSRCGEEFRRGQRPAAESPSGDVCEDCVQALKSPSPRLDTRGLALAARRAAAFDQALINLYPHLSHA